MKSYTHNGKIIVYALVFLLIGLSSSFAGVSNKSTKWNRISAIDEIYSLNSDIACSAKSDCEAIPMGHAACGGPNSYLIVSKKNKNLKEIRVKAVRLTERLVKEENAERAKSSNRPDGICAVLPPPEIECKDSKCAAVK